MELEATELHQRTPIYGFPDMIERVGALVKEHSKAEASI